MSSWVLDPMSGPPDDNMDVLVSSNVLTPTLSDIPHSFTISVTICVALLRSSAAPAQYAKLFPNLIDCQY